MKYMFVKENVSQDICIDTVSYSFSQFSGPNHSEQQESAHV